MNQIVLGLIIALFLPGYLIARIFFKEMSELEKIALAFVLSIAIDIFLGLFLGNNEQMKNLTGGITAMNLWIYLSGITLALLILYLLLNRHEVGEIIWRQKEFRIKRSLIHHQRKNDIFERNHGKL